MVFVSKSNNEILLIFLLVQIYIHFSFFLKNPLSYYNILTFRGPDIC